VEVTTNRAPTSVRVLGELLLAMRSPVARIRAGHDLPRRIGPAHKQ
jgi:hypothetical protein